VESDDESDVVSDVLELSVASTESEPVALDAVTVLSVAALDSPTPVVPVALDAPVVAVVAPAEPVVVPEAPVVVAAAVVAAGAVVAVVVAAPFVSCAQTPATARVARRQTRKNFMVGGVVDSVVVVELVGE